MKPALLICAMAFGLLWPAGVAGQGSPPGRGKANRATQAAGAQKEKPAKGKELQEKTAEAAAELAEGVGQDLEEVEALIKGGRVEEVVARVKGATRKMEEANAQLELIPIEEGSAESPSESVPLATPQEKKGAPAARPRGKPGEGPPPAHLTGRARAMERVERAAARHLEVLERVLAQVPEEAKPAIRHAIEVSQRGKAQALTRLRGEGEKPDHGKGRNGERPKKGKKF